MDIKLNNFIIANLKLRWNGDIVTRKIDILKMRNLINQGNFMFGVASAFGIVVRIGVHVGVRNGRPADSVRMGK